jgi:hypothetical protein
VLLSRLAWIALLPGCFLYKDPDPKPCNAAGADTVIMHSGDFAIHDTLDGAAIPLVSAPQGGHILLVGARVATTQRCEVTINAALRDPANNRVIGLEERAIIIDDRGDGWAEPTEWDSLSGMANVAVCPSSAASTRVDGNPFVLEVRLTASGTLISERTVSVVPTCGSGDTYCHSDCGAGGL